MKVSTSLMISLWVIVIAHIFGYINKGITIDGQTIMGMILFCTWAICKTLEERGK